MRASQCPTVIESVYPARAMPPDWLWIPITIGAALAQTVRNAAQRNLTPALGTLGATLVRFLYGLTFAIVWLVIVRQVGSFALPAATQSFVLWVVIGAIAQVAATALLLRVMAERNFALGVAYAKTEVLQIALIGYVLIGDPVSPGAMSAIAFSTVGLLLLSPIERDRPFRTLLSGWTTRAALLGLAAGACFALASVGFRGAALAVPDTHFMMAAAVTLVASQVFQTVFLGGWLLLRNRETVLRVCREWRASILAGFMGAMASAAWFTAFAIEPAAHVKTLALIEILFGYVVARRVFKEHVNRVEAIGMVFLCVGLALVLLQQ